MIQNENEYLLCNDGNKIYFVDKDPEIYINKLTLLYGESGSGKSTILQDILYILKDKISIPIVFSSTNVVNEAFSNIVPQEFIHGDVNIEKLQEIWDKQIERVQLFRIANNIKILKSIFDKVGKENEIIKAETISEKALNCISHYNNSKKYDHGARRSHIKFIESKKTKALIKLYKSCIRKYKNILKNMDLSYKEKIAINYLDCNPHIIIIFDDCMSTARKWSKEEIVKKLFYQGRQYYITQIYTLQDDHGISPDLRKNAMQSIFTSENVAISHFSTTSNGITKIDKKKAEKIIPRIFDQKRGSPKHYQKLVYDKSSSDKFKVIIADLHDDFTVGSSYLFKYIDKLPKKENSNKLIFNSDILNI